MSLPENYLPLLIQLAVAGGFVVTTIVGSHYLGPRRKGKLKEEAFECGTDSKGNARVHFFSKVKIQFYQHLITRISSVCNLIMPY